MATNARLSIANRVMHQGTLAAATPDHTNIAGYKRVENGTLMLFEILRTDIRPTPSDEDKIVEMDLQLDEELMETCTLGFMW